MAQSAILVLAVLGVLSASSAGVEAWNWPWSNWGWGRSQEVTEEDLIHLFDRPAEPIFTLRGVNRDVAFDVPVGLLPERYKKVAKILSKNARQWGVRTIVVPDLPMPVEEFADVPAKLPYRSKYTRASPVHIRLSVRFDHFFQNATSNAELLARAAWARLHFNPEMVLDGLRTTLVRRAGKQQYVQMPELTQYFPEMFVEDTFFAKAKEEMFSVPEHGRVVIQVLRNETQKNTNEAKTWYWLEDTHMNVFHWRWHVNYPPGYDDPEFTDRDRRGELFCYFHRQMLGRLNAERFLNGAPRLKPLDYKAPVEESFFPKMLLVHQNKGYASRQANSSMLAMESRVAQMDLWMERFNEALDQGYVVTAEGKQIPLVDIKGLDILGNLIEANGLLSPNLDYYGTIHNQLHGMMGGIHDPTGVNMEQLSTMSILPTVRDTGFFRLHTFIDDLYEQYKLKYMKPYKLDELTWNGVSVKSVSLISDRTKTENELHTYWQESDMDISMGMDYTPTGRVYGRFRHLQHEPFHYNIQVQNDGNQSKVAYVRLFLMILEDDKGQPLDPYVQQRFAIEMDRFGANLKPGLNTITRTSAQSALTIDQDLVYTEHKDKETIRRVNQCRCGWPQTLLVPRGTENGTTYRLFAMVTDYTEDMPPASGEEICFDGWIMCGVPGSKYYPDKRPMGYPFDRPYRQGVNTLEEFLTSNMAVQDVVVKFDDSRVDPPSAFLPGGISTSWMP